MVDKMSIRRALAKKLEIKDLVKEHVLPFLPAKSLIRFRSVSKEWDHRIKGPLMAIHQSYYFRQLSGFFCQFHESFDHDFLTLSPAYGVPCPSLRFIPEPVDIKSSSGGLLLCQGRNADNTYYVCNPATEAWKMLAKPYYYHELGTAAVLAFEPSLINLDAQFQVICAVPLHDQPVVCFEVYSSGTDSWTQSPTWCVELGESSFLNNGLYIKGLAYWLTKKKQVLAFNVENDSYDIIPLPRGCPTGGVLTKMQDELCYIGVLSSFTNEYAIMIYAGMHLGLKYCIDVHLEMELSDEVPFQPHRYRVLPCLDEGQVMILVGRWIYSYRLSDGRAELISRMEVCSSWNAVAYLPYVNTLACVS